MTARWAWRRLITAAVALLVSPVLAVVFSFSGAQGANPPIPVVSFGAPSAPLIGQAVTFDISFNNSSPTAAGYGPYVDLRLPKGADGNDGLTFTSATYLGASVTTVQLVANAGGCITHPYAVQVSGAPVQVCGLPVGQSYIVMRMPFGSFTPGQPAAVVHVTTQLSAYADAGTALTLTANGGFQFGADALANPATDPSVLGATVNTTVTPTIMRVTKTYNGPESETATGPNYPRSYTLQVTIAPGQTVANLVISDTLPNNVQYVSTTTPTTPASAPVLTPSTSIPGGTLSRNFGSVTGTGGVDATMTFQFYVPRLDSASGVILNASTGAFATSTDNASSSGSWTPTDVRDSAGPVSAGPASHVLTDKSIAVQKSVSVATDTGPAGVSPGDTLQWTISVQVSDYFALDTVVVDDLLGDGTRVDGSFTPTLAVTNNGSNSATADFDGANYTVSAVNGSGETPISFRVSNELVTRGQDGLMVGGCIVPVTGSNPPDCTTHNAGPTTATIVLRSIVQQTYVNGTSQVVEGDTLLNQAAATAKVLDTDTFVTTNNTIGDGSAGVATAGASASISIDRGTLTKTIYAINLSTSFTQPAHVSPGDTVTYRLQQTFPTSRTDDFRMTDFLPLPIFYAAGVSTFDTTADATAPDAGHAKYGPTDTFHALAAAPTPVVTNDPIANSVQFAYGDYAIYPPVVSTADILFTVTVSTDPFADGLLLTNQARSQTKNAVGTIQTADAIVQLTLDQPVVTITKGAVAADHVTASFTPATVGPVTFTSPTTPPVIACPGWSGGSVTTAGLTANPIDSNVSGLDAGDYVRFAVTLHNTGHSGAFDVKVKDTIPAGFVAPGGGVDLCVVNGAGATIATSNIGGGSGFFDQGLLLDDGASGAMAGGVSSGGVTNATGTNIVVITYTLRVDTSAVPTSVITNTATLTDYTNDDGSAGHLAGPLSDAATATMRAPTAAKTVNATNRAYTAGNDVVVGEIVTYRATFTIPEGTSPGAKVVDTLPAGLAFVQCDTITPSAGVTTSLGADFSGACNDPTNPTVGVDGQLVTFTLGDVVNANTDNTVPETITIDYDAVVLNLDTNVRGTLLHNNAVLSWTGGSIAATSATDLRVVEPDLDIVKLPGSASGDAGDTITYTITVRNLANAAGADAFDVEFQDEIPTGMTYTGGTWAQTGGLAADSMGGTGAPWLTAHWDNFPQGSTATFQYTATIDATVVPKQLMVNDAKTYWTSIPGDISATQTDYNTVGNERGYNVGNPGWIANDYQYETIANYDVPSATVAKTITATNLADTTGSNVAVGEVVTYQLVVTLPEGSQPSATIVDTLPAGLAFKDCTSIVNSNAVDVTTTLGADFSSACANDGSNPTPGASGQHVTFTLGSITNGNRNNGTAETLTITYRAVVLNVATNIRTRTLTNGAVFSWTGGSSSAGTSTVNVVEPNMVVTKTRLPITGDAGDTITYTVTITNGLNANQATGYNVDWTDTIPSDMTYVGSSLQRNSGNVPDVLTSTGVNGQDLHATWSSFAPSGTATVLQYQVTLNSSVQPGQVIPNAAVLTYMSLPDSVAGDAATSWNTLGAKRTGNQADTGTTANLYKSTSSVNVTISEPLPLKTVATTSETGTTSPYVAIGEVVRFRVSAIVPEGTFSLANIYDNLPPGLIYVNDNTATVAFVANGGGAGITSDAIGPGAGLQVTGDSTWAGDPTFVIPIGQIGGGPFLNGTDPIFNLGNLSNADRDIDSEMVVVEFNVVVENLAGYTRTANQNLSNTAAIRKNTTVIQTSAARVVTIAEPGITYNFTYQTIPTDGGDTIVYRINITNASGATYSPAYDFHATDAINANVTVSSIVPAGPGTWTDNSNVAAGTVDVTFDAVAPGTTNTITITGKVIDAVDAGQTIPNTAFATWTSLPGAGGTLTNPTGTNTPGAAGAATGERTGSGSGPNLYNTNFTNPITLAIPSIAKLGPTPATASVGGNTTFDLVVTLPEGTTRGLIIVDTLPAGLIPVGYHVEYLAANSNTRLTNDYPGTVNVVSSVPPSGSAGGAWTITLGDTYLPPDAIANNSFLLQITAQVANIAGNQIGVTRTNSASLKYTQGGTQTVNAPATRFVTVAEPAITIAKSAASTTPRVNDTVTYTLTISNPTLTNGATAYNLVVTDVLPAGLTYVPASLTNTAGAAATSVSVVGSTITLNYDSLAMPSSSTYQYQAVVGGSIALNTTLTNNARVTWTSQLGAVAEKRTGDDGIGGALNDYAAAITAPVTVSGLDLQLTKSDGQTKAVAAQVLTYTINYKNVGNQTATGVVITETVPMYTTYTGSGWTCAGGGAGGQTCTRSMGAVAAGANLNTTFQVTVVDPIPLGITQIFNTATVADDGSKNADPTADNTATDTDTIDQIDLSLTKTVDDSTPDANQVVVFTITVTNGGPAQATGVLVADVLPGTLTYVSSTPSQGSYASGTGVWTVGTINNGSNATLTLRARVTSSTPGTNSAQVTHADQADVDSVPNNGPGEDDYATASVTPNISDLAITKTPDNNHPDVGGDVTFTITVTNNGPAGDSGVVVTDTLPAGLTYKSSSVSQGAAFNSVTHTWAAGPIASGDTATLTLVATVANAGPITNATHVTGNSYDLNLANNDASTSVDQLVDLAVTKVVDEPAANVGTDVTFTITVENLGPGTATSVVMHDVLPAGLTWVSDSTVQGGYDHTTGDWAVGTIASGNSATLTITATLTSTTPVTNVASVKSLDEPQVSTANDSASASVTPPHADLAVVKTVSEARPEQGDGDTFTIKLTNNGPDDATNVVLTDPLPAGLTFVSYTATTGTYDEATGIWDVGPLETGVTATLTVEVTVVDANDYTNTATVTHSDQYDPNPANNTDDASLSTRVADIAVTKVPDDATPAVGATVVFTITATNNGPDNATQLNLYDLLPASLSYISSTPQAGTTYDPGTSTWTIGNLADGDTVTLTIRARVTGSGTITNTASVSHLLQRDSDSSNDAATATLDVPPAADLSLSKIVDVQTPDLNTNVTFTITVTNHGPNGVAGVHVQDILPAGLTYVSDTPSQGTFDSATGDWDVGGLGNGGSETLTLVVTVTVEGPVTNMAQVSGAGLPDPDSNPGNSDPTEDDQANAPLNSVGVADLSLTKTVESSAGIVGGNAVYSLTLHNAGPDGASHVVVRDQLPAGVTFISASGGTYDAVSGAWTVGNIGSGSSVTLQITVRIGRAGAITNVAEVATSDQRDPNSVPNDNVPSENDQSDAVLSSNQATPPPTAAKTPSSGDPGGFALWSLGLALAGLAVISLSVVTARNRAYRRFMK